MAETEWCSQRVFGYREVAGHQCSRKGTVERHGKLWCKQHDPEAVAARKAERKAKWDAEAEAKDAAHRAARDLAQRLGAGKPDYSWYTGTFTGGIVLTAEEAERLIERVESRG